jgi:hypothetical protein
MSNEDDRGGVALTSSEQGLTVDLDEGKTTEGQPSVDRSQLQAILNALA